MTEPRKTESQRVGRRLVGVIDFRNTRFWVTLLVVLLIVLNALAFALYAAAFPKQARERARRRTRAVMRGSRRSH